MHGLEGHTGLLSVLITQVFFDLLAFDNLHRMMCGRTVAMVALAFQDTTFLCAKLETTVDSRVVPRRIQPAGMADFRVSRPSRRASLGGKGRAASQATSQPTCTQYHTNTKNFSHGGRAIQAMGDHACAGSAPRCQGSTLAQCVGRVLSSPERGMAGIGAHGIATMADL